MIERKLAEAALRASEARLHALVTASSEVMYRMSPDWSEMRQLHGGDFIADTEEPTRNWLQQYIHPDDQPRVLAAIDEAIRTKSMFEMEHRVLRVNGSLGWTFSRAVPLQDANGEIIEWFGAATDITQRKQAEEALRESEKRYKFLTESIDDLFVALDQDLRFTYWNRRTEELTGISAEMALGRTRSELFGDTEVVRKVDALCRESMRTRRPMHYESEPVFGGWNRIYEVRLFPTANGVSCLSRDITERKRAEVELLESEERLSLVVQAADLGTWDWDILADHLVWSSRCLALFGLAPDTQMTYERFLEALHPADRERVDRAVQTALDRHEEYEMETRTVWPDGTVHWVATRGRAYFDTSGRAVRMSGVAMDITDRKQVEQSLIRSEKLASVGRMAATIAHEISNPLSSTINALFLVRTDPALPEEAKRYLSLAEQELNRVSHITKQTLGFYKEVGNPVALNAPEALDSILDLYAPRLKNKNISLQRSYGCSSRIFVIDGEFRQIVSGVIANSIDALPEGGTLHVRLSGPSALNAESRSMLRLTIADNGEGIAEENLKRIFEPFFTTKQSIGTGLGLWVTSELVKKNGGKLRLRSRLGKGTVVTLWLPVERRELERNAA
jgi:PAS domain S-box-containing protein